MPALYLLDEQDVRVWEGGGEEREVFAGKGIVWDGLWRDFGMRVASVREGTVLLFP